MKTSTRESKVQAPEEPSTARRGGGGTRPISSVSDPGGGGGDEAIRRHQRVLNGQWRGRTVISEGRDRESPVEGGGIMWASGAQERGPILRRATSKAQARGCRRPTRARGRRGEGRHLNHYPRDERSWRNGTAGPCRPNEGGSANDGLHLPFGDPG